MSYQGPINGGWPDGLPYRQQQCYVCGGTIAEDLECHCSTCEFCDEKNVRPDRVAEWIDEDERLCCCVDCEEEHRCAKCVKISPHPVDGEGECYECAEEYDEFTLRQDLKKADELMYRWPLMDEAQRLEAVEEFRTAWTPKTCSLIGHELIQAKSRLKQAEEDGAK